MGVVLIWAPARGSTSSEEGRTRQLPRWELEVQFLGRSTCGPCGGGPGIVSGIELLDCVVVLFVTF